MEGRMAKFFLAALLLIIIAAGGFWYWTTTPQYCMLKLAESVHKHDGATFRAYFDVDRVSRRAVDDLTANGVQEVGGQGLLQRLVGKTIGNFFKPELSQILAKKITDYVEKDPNAENLSQENQAAGGTQLEQSQPDTDQQSAAESGSQDPSSIPPAPRPGLFRRAVTGLFKKIGEFIKVPSFREVLQEMGLNKKNYQGLTPFETSGPLCHVALRFKPPDKNEIQVQLELENADNHWRVVRFSNLGSLAKSVSGI